MDEMSFKEKTITVTLINFSLILIYVLWRLRRMLATDTFVAERIFNLWGWVIFFAVVVSIIAIILANFGLTLLKAINENNPNPEIDDFEDERDQLIDLRGTRITYSFYSFGVLIAMLTFVLGQSALVMFTVLMVVGLVAQIAGDVTRLVLYRRGF
ncbi:MAG: hypothetical protein AAF846_25645 [Chloroflexota bacterium]